MKFDWVVQVSIVLGIVAMLGSVFTFDHARADQRERLARAGEKFENGGLLEYNTWRSAANAVSNTKSPEAEIDKLATRAAEHSALDERAFAGILWYWIALYELGQNPGPDPLENEGYISALGRAIGLLEDSDSRASDVAQSRYLWGHYLGRAHARLEDTESARVPLVVALESARDFGSLAGAEQAPRHLETLAGSFWMIGAPDLAAKAVEEMFRAWIFGTDAGFRSIVPDNRMINRFEELEVKEVLAIAVPLMREWLDLHGEQHSTRRSYIQLGWLYEYLGRDEDARAAWTRANEAWRRWSEQSPDPLNFYNLACTLSLLGEHAEALDALTRAVDLGFSSHELLESDRDLINIRESDRFAGILARVAELNFIEADPDAADSPMLIR
ncbi:tetratricopeptide repeat protein [Planctomycetaceae bacterium AH-315-I19]|nr:tetratricopeptide repeat protein [Planctomycetaceae bacterium AH-315-I19]